jgi:hypothetical protein
MQNTVSGMSVSCLKKITEGVMRLFGKLPNVISAIKICTSNRLMCINIHILLNAVAMDFSTVKVYQIIIQKSCRIPWIADKISTIT